MPFRRLRPEAKVPIRAYTGDSGYDLAAAEKVVLAPGERAVVSTGIAIAVPNGYAGLVLPRSGLATVRRLARQHSGAHRSRLPRRTPGPLINHDREETFEVEVGMRIAQLVLVKAAEARFVGVELLEGAPTTVEKEASAHRGLSRRQ